MMAASQRLKRRVKLRDLDTLMTVVSAGGMHKAAEHLHLSQPAVSGAIAALEDALGFPLLDRDRRGIEVTPYGTALIKRAIAMFDELEQGVRELEQLADPASGQIHLACSEPINGGLVGAAMDRMFKRYPRVRFELDSGDDPARVLRFLLDRGTDLVITRRYDAVIDPDLRAEPLFHEGLQVVVARSSPWASRRKLTLADLAEEPWILSRTETAGDSPVAEAFRAVGLPLPRCQVISGSLNVRYSLLATGRFITMMPTSFLRFGVARMTLKALPIAVGSWPMPTMALTLAGRSLNSATLAFLEIVRELAKEL